MPVFQLSKAPLFPRPELADPDGLLAVGGDLSLPRLIRAYAAGIFPWYGDDQPILWWSPDPRMVLRVDELHVSRSLKKVLRQGAFEIRCDSAFGEVIRACATTRLDEDESTWITTEMEDAYLDLHTLGLAHSVETWLDGALVGGLYGVYLGGMFCGESMFSRASNASKVAMVALCEYLRSQGVATVDCQLHTDHLQSLGAREMPRAEFLTLLREAMGRPTDTRRWTWPPPPPPTLPPEEDLPFEGEP